MVAGAVTGLKSAIRDMCLGNEFPIRIEENDHTSDGKVNEVGIQHERQFSEKSREQTAFTPYWKIPIIDDDDDEYTIQYREYLENSSNAITPDLPTEEPDNSLSMGDEHLSTIPETESDEVIKSSVENLVPIPMILRVIDDDFYEDIDYVEASPPDSELVSLEEVKDDILREKLLNINLLIAKIESLKDNPTPDYVLKSPSLFPIPVKDSDSFFEKSDTSLSYSDNSLPEFETFSDHTKETSSGSTTTHSNNSLPEYDSFLFEIEPDQGELTSVVMEDILGEPRVHVPNELPTHPTFMLDSTSILLMIPRSDLEVSFPSEPRNTILIQGIFIESNPRDFLSLDTFLSIQPGKITSDFSKSSMMISGGDIPFLAVLFLSSIPLNQHIKGIRIALEYETFVLRGFNHRPLDLQSFTCLFR
ncbi:hypothetical protein Tco_1464861 [Tanacetum coccineum]